MAASFVTGSGSYNIHFSGDFTLTFPFTPAAYDGGAGDTIVIVSLSISGLNTPTGYDRRVRVEINPGGSPTKWLEVWTKQAVGSETSQAINGIGTANDYAVAFFMRGVDDLTGWDQFATNYQMTTTITAPSVDVDHDDSYLFLRLLALSQPFARHDRLRAIGKHHVCRPTYRFGRLWDDDVNELVHSGRQSHDGFPASRHGR
jgi:hypothetical protein